MVNIQTINTVTVPSMVSNEGPDERPEIIVRIDLGHEFRCAQLQNFSQAIINSSQELGIYWLTCKSTK